MRILTTNLRHIATLALVLVAFSGCESTEGGGSVGGSVYYGVGINDPWYYGGYYDGPDVIVTPPPNRPEPPPQPTHPIAQPPAAGPRPTPLPSIPSAPRPMPRPAMRR